MKLNGWRLHLLYGKPAVETSFEAQKRFIFFHCTVCFLVQWLLF